MAPKRFSVDTTAEAEPLQFILEGTRLSLDDEGSEQPWSEEFTVLRDLPPGALSDLAVSASLDEKGEVVWSRMAVLRFLRAVIVPADEDRWDVLMRDKDRMIDFDSLGPVMFFITEKKSARPTGPRPSLPDGSRNGQIGSPVASSSHPEADVSTI